MDPQSILISADTPLSSHSRNFCQYCLRMQIFKGMKEDSAMQKGGRNISVMRKSVRVLLQHVLMMRKCSSQVCQPVFIGVN